MKRKKTLTLKSHDKLRIADWIRNKYTSFEAKGLSANDIAKLATKEFEIPVGRGNVHGLFRMCNLKPTGKSKSKKDPITKTKIIAMSDKALNKLLINQKVILQILEEITEDLDIDICIDEMEAQIRSQSQK